MAQQQIHDTKNKLEKAVLVSVHEIISNLILIMEDAHCF